MNIHMKLLRRSGELRATLREDGWVLLPAEGVEEVDASHPEVGDEDMARGRLDQLGLLTSGSIRIEFWPWYLAR